MPERPRREDAITVEDIFEALAKEPIEPEVLPPKGRVTLADVMGRLRGNQVEGAQAPTLPERWGIEEFVDDEWRTIEGVEEPSRRAAAESLMRGEGSKRRGSAPTRIADLTHGKSPVIDLESVIDVEPQRALPAMSEADEMAKLDEVIAETLGYKSTAKAFGRGVGRVAAKGAKYLPLVGAAAMYPDYAQAAEMYGEETGLSKYGPAGLAALGTVLPTPTLMDLQDLQRTHTEMPKSKGEGITKAVMSAGVAPGSAILYQKLLELLQGNQP